jgi:hypothetical protein
MLRKADLDPTRILPQIPMEVQEDLTMEVQPVQIMDQSIKELRNKKVSLVKVLWRNSQIEEETCERESEMMKKYPGLFSYIGMNLISRKKFFF